MEGDKFCQWMYGACVQRLRRSIKGDLLPLK